MDEFLLAAAVAGMQAWKYLELISNREIEGLVELHVHACSAKCSFSAQQRLCQCAGSARREEQVM